jgi:Bax protein
MLTLNSHPAYTALREIRATLRDRGQPLDGHSLADGLSKYSARGEEYVRSIQDMIRRFELASYEDAGRNKA